MQGGVYNLLRNGKEGKREDVGDCIHDDDEGCSDGEDDDSCDDVKDQEE